MLIFIRTIRVTYLIFSYQRFVFFSNSNCYTFCKEYKEECLMNNQEKVLRKNIGKKIKLARTKAEYTQEQLAEKLSLSPRYISQLERGIAFGSATTIINVCKVLHINSDFLFNDLINNGTTILDNITDNKFLQDYLKLDDYNKNVISIITNDLIKLQNKNKNENRNHA